MKCKWKDNTNTLVTIICLHLNSSHQILSVRTNLGLTFKIVIYSSIDTGIRFYSKRNSLYIFNN